MKKLFTLLLAFGSGIYAFGQSQRLIMFEEFTQASCPPCAATNPSLNALLNANEEKIVSVKYQTDWPGTDPMNLQNPTEVSTRVSYYNVSGVPDGEMDGNVFNNQPANLTQNDIDNRYSVPSPFIITIEHALSPANDSIFVTATIKATQAVSGNLVFQLAVIERNIYFTAPPGTNGEKAFEGVMKKMLPNDQGTSLAASWAVDDSIVINESWALSNVYDINQIAVVGWVQDNTTKEVHQAGYSRTHMPLDIGIHAIGISDVQCTTTITPSLTINNYGTDILTSCTVNYKIDNGALSNLPWTGSLAPGTSAVVALPTITTTSGSHTFTAYTTIPNGGVDLDTHNDSYAKIFSVTSIPVGVPVVEGFQAALFPPTNWIKVNPDNGVSWIKSAGGGYATSTFSAKMDYYNSPAGNIDELYMPALDLTNANSMAPATLTFDIAYAYYTDGTYTYYDTLALMGSSDCGATWSELWVKGGDDLSTAPAVGTAFTPNANTWRTESVNVASYIGQPEVLVKFQARSGYGNNAYVDNINLNFTTGIISLENNELIDLYPVPSNGIVNLHTRFNVPTSMQINVTNALGQKVYSIEKNSAAEQRMTLDLSGQAAGTYFVNIVTNKGTETRKINLNK